MLLSIHGIFFNKSLCRGGINFFLKSVDFSNPEIIVSELMFFKTACVLACVCVCCMCTDILCECGNKSFQIFCLVWFFYHRHKAAFLFFIPLIISDGGLMERPARRPHSSALPWEAWVSKQCLR